MEEYEKIVAQLQSIYQGNIGLSVIKSLHDEDGPDMTMITYNDLIVANPEYGLEVAAKNILGIKLEELWSIEKSELE